MLFLMKKGWGWYLHLAAVAHISENDFVMILV
jgi:hypothetical protein